MVIFTSDNGPHEGRRRRSGVFNRDGLLKGTKRSTNEGGIRDTLHSTLAGKVAAGVENDHMFAFYDLMATFCDIAGIENYEEKYRNPKLENDWFDGISIYPTPHRQRRTGKAQISLLGIPRDQYVGPAHGQLENGGEKRQLLPL